MNTFIYTSLLNSSSLNRFFVVADIAFLLCIGCMLFLFIHWFIKLMRQNILIDQKHMSDMLSRQNEQVNVIQNISDKVDSEAFERTKLIIQYAYNAAQEEVFYVLERIRREGVPEDRDFVRNEVRQIIERIYFKRKVEFESFSYDNKQLSSYINAEWMERVINVFIDELYDENYCTEKAHLNIQNVYTEIKNEFYNRLKTQ